MKPSTVSVAVLVLSAVINLGLLSKIPAESLKPSKFSLITVFVIAIVFSTLSFFHVIGAIAWQLTTVACSLFFTFTLAKVALKERSRLP